MRETDGGTLIQRVVAILEEEHCTYALIGAMAMLAHDAPRTTLDIDLLTTEDRTLRIGWRERLPADVEIDIRPGEYDDPLAGVITFEHGGEPSVDLVIGRWKWQQAAVARAVPVQLLGVSIPVIVAADLVITKVDAGGYRDQLDVEFLFERLGESLLDVVRARIPELPSSLQRDCEALLQKLRDRKG